MSDTMQEQIDRLADSINANAIVSRQTISMIAALQYKLDAATESAAKICDDLAEAEKGREYIGDKIVMATFLLCAAAIRASKYQNTEPK